MNETFSPFELETLKSVLTSKSNSENSCAGNKWLVYVPYIDNELNKLYV